MYEDLVDGFGSFIWEIGNEVFKEEGECGVGVLSEYWVDCCWVFWC